jgi:hypothetical protein
MKQWGSHQIKLDRNVEIISTYATSTSLYNKRLEAVIKYSHQTGASKMFYRVTCFGKIEKETKSFRVAVDFYNGA